ncbi:MAG: hypothetical protein M3Y37_03555 [Chloroflexota bacterium]|nr:hypothetical protein [Chloroflexota bacterium]
MARFHILVAHAAHTYASALAGVLTHVRPEFDVQLVQAADLARDMAAFPDALVISDQLDRDAAQPASGLILYYPALQDVAVVRVGECEKTLLAPDLETIIAAVDRLAERWERSAALAEPCLPVP